MESVPVWLSIVLPLVQGSIERCAKLLPALPAWNEGFWSIFWHPALENTQKREERF